MGREPTTHYGGKQVRARHGKRAHGALRRKIGATASWEESPRRVTEKNRCERVMEREPTTRYEEKQVRARHGKRAHDALRRKTGATASWIKSP